MPEQNTEKQRGIRNPVCTGTLSLFRKFCVKTPISDRAWTAENLKDCASQLYIPAVPLAATAALPKMPKPNHIRSFISHLISDCAHNR